jgi:hypothetical protein
MLTVSISIAQNNGTPSQMTITDTSTGSDGTITTRRIYLYKADNTNLVESGTTTAYENWPIGDGPITLDVLDRDYALMVVVQWLAGTTVVYSLTNYYVFTANAKNFLYELTETNQLSNPAILKDTQYLFNKLLMWEYVDDAELAITYDDVLKSQLALDAAYNMIVNQNIYF